MKTLYLHIGTHKTGSTSLQDYLINHAKALEGQGLAFYNGMIEPGNHLELHVASMRTQRMSFSKEKYNISNTPDYIRLVSENVRRFQNTHNDKDIIFTSEAINLLRHDDEIEQLKDILHSSTYEVKIVCVFRNPIFFMKSYRAQIKKAQNRHFSDDPKSHLYVEDDSWIFDYEAVREIWTRHFGAKNFIELNYDKIMDASNNVLPSVLGALGLPDVLISDTHKYQSNKNGFTARLRRFLFKLLNR